MTTPGGVPNLPAGGMTLDTLQSMLQDMTPPAMRGRAAQRIPGTYDGSTGGNPLNDLTPFGILTTLFAGFNSHVANADPADIQGPDDLPGLLLDFIESLPVIGELVGLLEAILGTYDGDDAILLEIQKFFGLFRDLFGLIDLDLDDLPTVEEVWQLVVTNFIQPLLDLVGAIGDGLNAILSPIFNGIDFTDPPTPAEVWQTIATVFLAPLNIFAIPSEVQASINGALGDLQDALDGSYTGSGPIFLAVQALAEAWLKSTDPLNPANIAGRLRSWQIGGVPLANVINQSENLFADFISAASVPNVDGWSYDAANKAAQVVLDGTTKAIYDDPVDVAPGQELDASIQALLASVASTPGSAVQLALLTYDGVSETPTGTVVLASIANPSGSATWATLSGTYTVPASGVKAVAPTLKVVGGTSGTVKFKTPAGELVLPDVLHGGLPNIFEELRKIFAAAPVDAPQNPVADVIKNWWDTFFGGGPRNVVTQNQVADASGIPPVDANVKIPYEYLPVEIMSVAMGLPWVEVVKTGANQAITASTDTLLTGWSQDGPATIIISGNKFKLPFDGMWNLEIGVKWSGSSVLGNTTQTINLKQNDVLIRDDVSFGTAANKIQLAIPAATTDEFSAYAFTAASGLSVLTAGTFIRATYLGMTTVPSLPPPPDPVTFDAAGGGDFGGGSSLSWSHTFGPNANAIVVPISHQGSSAPTVSVSGIGTVPVLSGPTYLGNYTIYACRYSLAAAILPAAVKGTTRTITVTFSGNEAASANSMSFNGVGALGEVMVSSGSGSPVNPNILVPSNVSSMVACGFGGMNGNFSGFNRTLVDQWNFIEFQCWSHVMGYAMGGQQFTATNGSKWAAKAIELHP